MTTSRIASTKKMSPEGGQATQHIFHHGYGSIGQDTAPGRVLSNSALPLQKHLLSSKVEPSTYKAGSPLTTQRPFSANESSIEILGYYKPPVQLQTFREAEHRIISKGQAPYEISSTPSQPSLTSRGCPSESNSIHVHGTLSLDAGSHIFQKDEETPKHDSNRHGHPKYNNEHLRCDTLVRTTSNSGLQFGISVNQKTHRDLVNLCDVSQNTPLYEQLSRIHLNTLHEPLRLIGNQANASDSLNDTSLTSSRGHASQCVESGDSHHQFRGFSEKNNQSNSIDPCTTLNLYRNNPDIKAKSLKTPRPLEIPNHPAQDSSSIDSCRYRPWVSQLPREQQYSSVNGSSCQATSRAHHALTKDVTDLYTDQDIYEQQDETYTNYSTPRVFGTNAWDENYTSSEQGIHLSLVPRCQESDKPVFREIYRVILHSLEDVAPFYLDWARYQFYLKFIHFPTRHHPEEPIVTDPIGPFISDMSPNGLTVRCDMKNSLIEIPYLKGMELRIEVFQQHQSRSHMVGRARLPIHVALETLCTEWVTLLDNGFIPVETTGYSRGALNLSVIGHIDQTIPSNPTHPSSFSQNELYHRESDRLASFQNTTSYQKYTNAALPQKGILSDLFFSFIDNFFTNSYDQQTRNSAGEKSSYAAQQRRRRPHGLHNSSFSVFCMDLPESLCTLTISSPSSSQCCSRKTSRLRTTTFY